MHTLSHSCFDCCCKDFKRMPLRRVALLPAPASTLASTLSPGLAGYQKALGNIEEKYSAMEMKRSRKKKKAPKTSKADEALIQAATDLQERHKKKFNLARFVKKEKLKRSRASKSPSLGINKRTTLISLVKRIPDAKKPFAQWLT